jgi:spoIIIJ-associated protein
MKGIEQEGTTIEEAVRLAAEKLGLPIDRLKIKVLDEGSKGVLGIGGRKARIWVEPISDIADKAREILKGILVRMGLDVDMRVQEEGNGVRIELEDSCGGVLIGKHGQTLNALQYILTRVLNKEGEERIRVTIDVENYRERRKRVLEGMARKMARRAKETGKEIILEPMNPYERRIIHMALKDIKDVRTYSLGNGLFRRVVISPSRKEDVSHETMEGGEW